MKGTHVLRISFLKLIKNTRMHYLSFRNHRVMFLPGRAKAFESMNVAYSLAYFHFIWKSLLSIIKI